MSPPRAVLALLIAATLSVGVRAHEDEDDAHRVVRGMTVSCPTWGWEWGSDDMVETMKELKALGVNWITFHPYASIGNDGRVGSRRLREGETAPEWITRPIAEAHRLGLKVLVKPHLAYWGSRFSWRGEIEFSGEAAWKRFFSTYRAWISTVAEMSRGADAFAVGTELDKTLGFEDEWRAVIRDVRAKFSGHLTYAANWSDYRKVSFWDALDVIGIQAYFPLVEPQRGADGTIVRAPVTRKTLADGWKRIMAELGAYSRKLDREIVFTELGYNRSALAPYEPWDHAVGGDDAEELQTMCLEAALRAVAAEPCVCGSFLWKWFPGRRRPRNFDMSSGAVRGLLTKHWAG